MLRQDPAYLYPDTIKNNIKNILVFTLIVGILIKNYLVFTIVGRGVTRL